MRYLLAYAFVLLTFTAMYGQERGNVRNQALEILEQLDLSPVQKDKIDQLRLKYKDLFDHVVRSTPNRQDRTEKRKQLQKDLRMEMRDVLTPSQQRKFRELNKQAREKQSRVGLQESIQWAEPSEEQQAKIESLLKVQKLKVKEMRQQTLTMEERQSKMREIKLETITSLREILSQEQFDRFEEHVNKRIQRSSN